MDCVGLHAAIYHEGLANLGEQIQRALVLDVNDVEARKAIRNASNLTIDLAIDFYSKVSDCVEDESSRCEGIKAFWTHVLGEDIISQARASNSRYPSRADYAWGSQNGPPSCHPGGES